MPDLHECMFDCPHSDQIEPLNVETRMAFISFWVLFIFITLGNMLQMCTKNCCVSPVFFLVCFCNQFPTVHKWKSISKRQNIFGVFMVFENFFWPTALFPKKKSVNMYESSGPISGHWTVHLLLDACPIWFNFRGGFLYYCQLYNPRKFMWKWWTFGFYFSMKITQWELFHPFLWYSAI